MTDTIMESLGREAQSIMPWMLERRRHLHQHPEISFEEKETATFLRREMEGLGFECSRPVGGHHGFYTELKSPSNPGEYVVLRTDIDALPIHEENEVPFKSTRPGVGHLCGHDAHMSMLMGAARLLKARQAELPVSVRFLFQHAEELAPGGARDFVKAGLVDDAIGVFGIHVSPLSPVGTIAMNVGETMAAASKIVVKVIGRGGHAAYPHHTIDPVLATANIIVALQQIVSRRINPIEPCVLSICSLHGGDASNVIPNEVTFSGTFRTFVPERVDDLTDMVTRISATTAEAFGCRVEVDIDKGYPPVINDKVAVAAAKRVASSLFGAENVLEKKPTMGGEDFAYYAQRKPGAFVFLGVQDPAKEVFPLHHPRFLPEETAFWRGAAYLGSLPFVAKEFLN